MFGWLHPQDTLSEADTERGLRMIIYDATCSQAMSVLTLGPFMIAFAVSLGASNFIIGLIGAIGPLAAVLQVPSIFIVERMRTRKLLVFVLGVMFRSCWIAAALIPFLAPRELRIPVLLAVLTLNYSLGSVSACAYLSWIRDVVPERVMGAFYSKKMAFATGITALVSLVGAVGIDTYTEWFADESQAYGVLFLVGAACGFVGLLFLARIPEARMHSSLEQGFSRLLLEPFRDKNYRALMVFLSLWVFATNFAGPFFTVYMLRRLEFSMALILSLTVISQLLHIAALRIWGRLADRFNNRSIITVAAPVFLLCLLGWPMMSMTSGGFTLLFAVLFHAFTGIASAGIGLGAGNLTLLLAPRGRGTAYLSLISLVQGVAAAIAPLIAGLAADALERHRMAITFRWHYEGPAPVDVGFPALVLEGLDFVFLAAVVFGFYAVHRLIAVHEDGGAPTREVQRQFLGELAPLLTKVSTVAGLRHFGSLAVFAWSKVVKTPEANGRDGD